MLDGLFENGFLNSRTDKDHITIREKLLGFFLGPVAVMLMNAILTNYLNVYYTDVLDLSHIWGGLFLGAFPVVAKVLDVMTFVLMGKIVDRTETKQGKARPWLLISAPLLSACMIMLFAVPMGDENITAIWIFVSYTVFYAIAFTMYSTAHTLMVPLATDNPKERTSLSTISNAPGMLAGTLIAVLFPMLILPRIGVSRQGWLAVMEITAIAAFPVIILEYLYTRERVTEREQKKDTPSNEDKLSFKVQISCCLKSPMWRRLMIYTILSQIVNALFSSSAIYYCNWILGTYNDGTTQAMFYALGQFPMGIGLFAVGPVSSCLGRKRTISYGFVLAFLGTILCILNPANISVVMIGQIIRSIGIIPGAYLFQGLFGDALDDVENRCGVRCDGFASSVFNSIVTLAGGVSLFAFNLGLAKLGYIAPVNSQSIIQPDAVNSFIVFCVMGIQLIIYPVLAVISACFPEKTEIPLASAHTSF